MVFQQKQPFPTENQFIVIVITAVTTILIFFTIFAFYPMQQNDMKLIDDLKKEIQDNQKETALEQAKLKSISCKDLKIAIGNNEFKMLNQEANNQYLGRCT